MNARIIKIAVFLLFAATLVSGSGIFGKSKKKKNSESWTSKLCSRIGAFFKRKAKQKRYQEKSKIENRRNIISKHENVIQLEHMLKHVENLMCVEVLMKFKMISPRLKKMRFGQASINSDMHFVKYGDQIEILGTENYRPGLHRFYDPNDKLNEHEKQFLIDFAARHEPLNQFSFAADWYFFDELRKTDYYFRNTSKLCVIANKVDDKTITGEVREWDKQSWEHDNKKYSVKDYYPYNAKGCIDFEMLEEKTYDNVTEMILRNGKRLATERCFPNQLSSALWAGPKSTLSILRKIKNIDVNEQLPIGLNYINIAGDTAFEFAVKNDMLLVVDKMLKNHNPKLDKTNQVDGSTVLHQATTCNMLRLLVKALKKKCLLKTVLKTRDAKGRYSYEKQELYKNKCGSDFLRKEYSELPMFPWSCLIM